MNQIQQLKRIAELEELIGLKTLGDKRLFMRHEGVTTNMDYLQKLEANYKAIIA